MKPTLAQIEMAIEEYTKTVRKADKAIAEATAAQERMKAFLAELFPAQDDKMLPPRPRISDYAPKAKTTTPLPPLSEADEGRLSSLMKTMTR